MNTTLNIHPYPGYKEDKVAYGWETVEGTIENINDAKELFCGYHYSPHLWKDGIRKQENYIASNGLVVDYDNGLTIDDAKRRFKDFKYVLVTSRNHLKIKEKKEHLGAVDRFHVFFPLNTAISDPKLYSAYQNHEIFEDADSTGFETARFFYKSPQDAHIDINESGDYLDVKIPPHKIPVEIYAKASSSKQFTREDLERIFTHCKAAQGAVNDIRQGEAENSAGHHKRLLIANMISNTINDEEYVLDLFKNVSDFDPRKTLKQYDSVRKQKPLTCKRLQSGGWNHLCRETCPLMKDLKRKSPITFAYRDMEGLKLNSELLSNLGKNENLEELLRRARFYGSTPDRESLISQISGLRGVPPTKISKMMDFMEYKDDDTVELDNLCHNWYRIGSKFSEIVILPQSGDIRITNRGAEDVETRLGRQAKKYIIEKKSLPDPIDFDFVGGSGRSIGYDQTDSGLIGYAPLPPVVKTDNKLINDTLNEWFGEYADFIKSFIASYTYSNFLHLPVLIITGPRGNGKSLFAEVLGMIYPKITGRFDTKTQFSEHNGLKLSVIEEADEFDNQNLYSIIKDVGGSAMLLKNIKYGPKTMVRNNLNLIVISNNKIPIYLKSKEMPTGENNNQFFVWEFPVLSKNPDNGLKQKIADRIGYWLRTELKDIYDELELRTDKSDYRYQIPVPITKQEELLFENNRTEIEGILDDFLEELKTPYILSTDLRLLETKHNIRLNSFKRKLVDMEVIESTKSYQANRKLLSSIDGFKHDRSRIYKLTRRFREEFYEKMRKLGHL